MERKVPRVAREILVGAELQRVDEDADDDSVSELPRAVHEAQMTFVEVAHGGNEADGVAARALGARPGARLGKGGELAQLEHALLHLRKEVATLDVIVRTDGREGRGIELARFGFGLRRLWHVLLDQLLEDFL